MNTNKSFANKLNTVMLWLFCFTLFLVFLPWESISTEIAQKLNENRNYLYLALVIEGSNLITMLLLSIFVAFKDNHNKKRLTQRIEKNVQNLDFAQKALLREFVLQRKSVLALPATEPTVAELVQGGILKQVGINDEDTQNTNFMISKEARSFVSYKALGLSLGKMSEEQISQIIAARPSYAREKQSMTRRVSLGARSIKSVLAQSKELEATANLAA